MRFAFYAARAHYCFPLPRSFNRQAPRRRISVMCISVFSADTEIVIRPLPPAALMVRSRIQLRRPRFFGLFARRAVLHFPLDSPCFPPAPPFCTFTRESLCSRFPRLSRSPRRVDFSAFASGVLCFLRRRCLLRQKSAVKKGDGNCRAEWSVCYRYSYVSPLPLCRGRLTPHYLMRQSRRFKFRKMRPAAAAFPAVRLRLARTRSAVAT